MHIILTTLALIDLMYSQNTSLIVFVALTKYRQGHSLTLLCDFGSCCAVVEHDVHLHSVDLGFRHLAVLSFFS